MTREQLEHLIRACSTIAEDDELVIIGSRALIEGLLDRDFRDALR